MGKSASGNLFLGVCLIIASCFFQALMNAFVKEAALTYSMYQILFMQNLVCLLLLLPQTIKRRKEGVKTAQLKLHLLRDLVGVAGYFCTFYAVHYIPLVDAVLLVNAAPLYIPFILLLWDRAPLQRGIWKSLIIGFIGILLILKPGAELFRSQTIVAIISGISYAYVLVSIRRLHDRGEPTWRILFYLFLVGALVTFPFALQTWLEPNALGWIMLCGVGLATILTQYCMTHGLKYGKIHVLAPLFYSSVVFAFFIDWVIWDVTPHLITSVGIVLVVIAGSITWMRESKILTVEEQKKTR